MKKFILLTGLFLSAQWLPANAQKLISHTPYLNQNRPGLKAQIFAPEIVSLKDRYEYGSVFSADGKEFYYAAIINKKPQIHMIQLLKDGWSEPAVVIASDKYEYNDPFLSPDQSKLFFISDQAADGQGPVKDFDIWYLEREKDGWSKPVNAGPSINTSKHEYYMSFSSDGKMYFSSNGATNQADDKNFDIFSSKFSDGKFQPSQKLTGAINSEFYEADVFISPNEQYIIFCGERPDGSGKGDLYISFKDANGIWQKAKNMGNLVNTDGYEFCPFVTSDGKYLFFSRDGDIYWMSADVIETLK